MKMKDSIVYVRTMCLVIALWCMGTVSSAENLFSPAIRVNDQIITVYELRQREELLRLLNAPGDPAKLARTQLIEDRLKLAAARELGLKPTEEEVREAIENFTARGNLDSVTFITELEKLGVSEETFQDFIVAGLSWRMFVGAKFASKSQVSDTEIERSLNTSGGNGGLRVLLTEIILPAPPGQEEAALELAKDLSKITSINAFSDAAREHSVAPTRSVGGRVTWQDLDKLPPVLKPLVLGLGIGEVTEPLPIPNGLAIFQLRAIAEKGFVRPESAALDYAQYKFPSNMAGHQNTILQTIDQCDDLYGLALKYPDHRLTREARAPAEVTSELKSLLETLDLNEMNFSERAGTTTLTMLCARSQSILDSEEDLTKLRAGLRNKRIEQYAQGYLDNLLQDARIIDK